MHQSYVPPKRTMVNYSSAQQHENNATLSFTLGGTDFSYMPLLSNWGVQTEGAAWKASHITER